MHDINEVGELALGTRLKRISDHLYNEADEIYRASEIDFQGRWFPVVYLLSQNEAMGITEIADHLGQTHSAVSQLSRKLRESGLVEDQTDPEDTRRRLLQLSPSGRHLAARLEPLWTDISCSIKALITETGHDLLLALARFERQLEQQPLHKLVLRRGQARRQSQVEIIDYEPRYQPDFQRLNEEWLNRYFYVEAIDNEVLSDPQQHILAGGGQIFFARLGEEIVGTCALIVEGDGFELSKMAVTESHQGLKIGRRLMQHALRAYRESGRRGLFLETNSRLAPAIHLYESMGFERQPTSKPDSHYQRADVYMTLNEAEYERRLG